MDYLVIVSADSNIDKNLDMRLDKNTESIVS